ncbi:hypothetical protein [Larkinella terrae]|uniref:Uncharacterized protein n=1 Tax=Larkinella terrae TaxID=2025311 RepID=A0A7K0EKJ5_9BACT|nr:hypothetical protein [Larkinella terrae]MRS62329.1 hypothetical protein [Larkinella terrae]
MENEINEQDIAKIDNRNRPEQENSANGMDSREITGGEDGRNDRFIGSTDMDSANGLLRFNDQENDNPAEDITEEGQESIAGTKTNTSTVDVTTHGPDDYASSEDVPTPEAQKAAKKQDKVSKADQDQEKTEEDVAHTGTSTEHKPVY